MSIFLDTTLYLKLESYLIFIVYYWDIIVLYTVHKYDTEWVIFLHIDMHMPLALVDLVVLGLIQVVNKYGKGYMYRYYLLYEITVKDF